MLNIFTDQLVNMILPMHGGQLQLSSHQLLAFSGSVLLIALVDGLLKNHLGRYLSLVAFVIFFSWLFGPLAFGTYFALVLMLTAPKLKNYGWHFIYGAVVAAALYINDFSSNMLVVAFLLVYLIYQFTTMSARLKVKLLIGVSFVWALLIVVLKGSALRYLTELNLGIIFFMFSGLRVLYYYLDVRDLKHQNQQENFFFFMQVYDLIGGSWWGRVGPGAREFANAKNNNASVNIIQGLKLFFYSLIYLFITTVLAHFNLLELERFVHEGRFLVLLKVVLWFLGVFAGTTALYHFKVGLFNIAGYSIEPCTHHVWKSRSLSEFWLRYSRYYMRLILRLFYLPIFLHLRGFRLIARKALSLALSILVGQFLIYSMTRLISNNVQIALALPYFILLGIAIFLNSEAIPQGGQEEDLKGRGGYIKSCGFFALIWLFYSLMHLFLSAEPVKIGFFTYLIGLKS